MRILSVMVLTSALVGERDTVRRMRNEMVVVVVGVSMMLLRLEVGRDSHLI